ncbi:MAG: chloride channel protein [Oligoflexia bacterium]|nr:chloride channel protein [Oligoflexia bacterium]
MTFRPLLAGLLASGVVALPNILDGLVRMNHPGSIVFGPYALIGILLVAYLLQRHVIERHAGPRIYQGLADLLFHIHAPSSPDSSLRWLTRGVISLLLAAFGGYAGPEGAALELSHAFFINVRSRTARWFEHRRRTDAACAMAAAISASFGAPFAAVLLPLELGIGGRTISAAISALAAFIGIRYFSEIFSVRTFDLVGSLYGFSFLRWQEWLAVLVIAVGCGLGGAGIVRFIHYTQEGLQRVFVGGGSLRLTKQWSGRVRLLLGALLLFAVALAFRQGLVPSSHLLEEVLWGRRPTEAGLFFFGRLLSLALVISVFGTSGIFWPLFAIGGFLGFELNRVLLGGIPGFSAAAGLIGASALWGAIFGAPVAGAILAFELTHHLQILFPCLVAGVVAREVARRLGTPRLTDRDLESRGLRIAEGRSVAVLSKVMVKEAMVVDFEAVHEQQPVAELAGRLGKSPYPFFPVVKGRNTYSALLTLDVVQDALHTDQIVGSPSSLSKLLEVKDLLYRTGFRTGAVPTARPEQKLSELSRQLEQFPCLPVVGDEGEILGLLLVQNVRLAYDREVARRSLEPPVS